MKFYLAICSRRNTLKLTTVLNKYIEIHSLEKQIKLLYSEFFPKPDISCWPLIVKCNDIKIHLKICISVQLHKQVC